LKSFLVMSVMIAALVIPALAARARSPRRGVRWMLLLLFVFNLAYVAYMALIHTEVFVPRW
jgi:hypothetical protein